MRNYFIIVLLCITSLGYTQSLKYGEVSIQELQQNVYTRDTSASAVIVVKKRKSSLLFKSFNQLYVETEVHERIKILKKDGLDYATKKINIYRSRSKKEKIIDIEGYTYNLENEKLVRQELMNNAIYSTIDSDNWTETSFTMPNVKVGSIVEWVYTVESPFWKIDDLELQYDIPIANYYCRVSTPGHFNFKRIIRGSMDVKPNDLSKHAQKSFGSSTMDYTEMIAEYRLNHISGIKYEPFVDNIENYRPSITYELQSVKLPYGKDGFYSRSWDEVAMTMDKNEFFGNRLKYANFFNRDLKAIISDSQNDKEKVNLIFQFVRDRMSWNGKNTKYSRDGLKKAYAEKSGNVADINLLLVAMLGKAGVKSHPVLVSTKSHGIVSFPSVEGFNYVIASAIVNGDTILLDATEKHGIPNILPSRVINEKGLLLGGSDKAEKISLIPKRRSKKSTLVNINISNDGDIVGSVKSNYTGVRALEYRNKYENITKEDHAESILNNYNFADIFNFEIKNQDNLEKPIQESYDFELREGIDIVGDEMYISPLFFLTMTENPFKAETRQFPIDFVYPLSTKKIVSVKLPEDYEVGELPEPLKMALPDGMGSFLYNVKKVEGGLNILSDYKINIAKIPSHKYAEIKQFFRQRLLKESEKIILKKK